MPHLISIVVPTYNEKENIPILAEQLFGVLKKNRMEAELIVVDDNSPDGTGAVADRLAGQYSMRVIHRPGKLGLSSAVVDGFAACRGDIIGVMDADLSHPPNVVPSLIEPLLNGSADIVVGSRYVAGGSTENWPLHRKIVSAGARMLARPLTPVRDCVSGLFFLRRSVIEGVALNPRGYKIGLEVLVKGRYSNAVEVPFTFTNRKRGKTKLNNREIANYLLHLASLYRYAIANKFRGSRTTS